MLLCYDASAILPVDPDNLCAHDDLAKFRP